MENNLAVPQTVHRSGHVTRQFHPLEALCGLTTPWCGPRVLALQSPIHSVSLLASFESALSYPAGTHHTRVGSHSFRTCRCPPEIHSFTEPTGPKSGPQPRFLGVPSAPHSFLQVHGCWSNHQCPKLMSCGHSQIPQPGTRTFRLSSS